ncbi:hypothetical protein NMG60_11026047 [Bertholletia excelsa]
MADMYSTPCSSSSSPAEPDDFSLLLQQIFLRSSSSYSTMSPNPSLIPASDRRVPDSISAVESSCGLNSSLGAGFSSSAGEYFPASVKNVSSSSVGTMDNEPDDYDCESEEGFEALIGEVQAKPVPPRNPSKRSRAAEVHNMSEKRRRRRINEKMKALQNLIPNSNKTDKASMLDEAIGYLKQLQLQVQMLTMRHGLSLYPMCQPGVLQSAQLAQMKMGFHEGNGPLNMVGTIMPPANQEPTNALFNVPKQNTNQAQVTMANLSSIINSEASFGMGSSIQDHPPFQLQTSSQVKDICQEDVFSHQQFDVDDPQTNSLGAERPESLLLPNLESDLIHSSYLNGMCGGQNEKVDIKSAD